MADKAAPAQGTTIVLNGLKEALLEAEKPMHCNHGDRLRQKIQDYAKGFAVPVELDGVELKRPHAQSNLIGKRTPYGFVHVKSIHMEEDKPQAISFEAKITMALYLQGLPIEAHVHSPDAIVHLDAQMFTPVMPDRATLYDGKAGLDAVSQEIMQMARDYLAEQKAKLDGKTFVETYWDNCRKLGVAHLLNDIPLFPGQLLRTLMNLTYRVQDRWSEIYARRYSESVSKDKFDDGSVKAWRDVPEDIDDSNYWAVLQARMESEGILKASTTGLDAGHWIFSVTPSCDDFEITVDPVGLLDKRDDFYQDGYGCTILVVDAVNIRITSSVDPSFLIEETINSDYVVVGQEEELPANHYGDYSVVCYVMKSMQPSFEPVALFSSFEDESDDYREEWEADAVHQWDTAINHLFDKSLAENLDRSKDKLDLVCPQYQVGQMALFHVQEHWDRHANDYSVRALAVTELEDSELWGRFAQLLQGQTLDATTVKQAFMAATGADKKIGGPDEAVKQD